MQGEWDNTGSYSGTQADEVFDMTHASKPLAGALGNMVVIIRGYIREPWFKGSPVWFQAHAPCNKPQLYSPGVPGGRCVRRHLLLPGSLGSLGPSRYTCKLSRTQDSPEKPAIAWSLGASNNSFLNLKPYKGRKKNTHTHNTLT